MKNHESYARAHVSSLTKSRKGQTHAVLCMSKELTAESLAHQKILAAAAVVCSQLEAVVIPQEMVTACAELRLAIQHGQ